MLLNYIDIILIIRGGLKIKLGLFSMIGHCLSEALAKNFGWFMWPVKQKENLVLSQGKKRGLAIGSEFM